MSSALYVEDKHLKIVLDILKQYIQKNTGIEIYAYGSRVKNTHKKYSDLDLVIINNSAEKLDFLLTADLREEFEESDLPYTVDILEYAGLPEHMEQEINKLKVKIY